MFCSRCGAQNPEGVKFCNDCGESLQTKTQKSGNGIGIFWKLIRFGVIAWIVLLLMDIVYRLNTYYLNPAYYAPGHAQPIETALAGTVICLGSWSVISVILAFVFSVLKRI